MANPKLIALTAATAQPLVLRSRYVREIALAVNKNTVAARPPRNVNGGDLAREGLAQALLDGHIPQLEGTTDQIPLTTERWDEVSRTTSEVRVTNPDDEDQFVDVLRIESVRFTREDGTAAELIFDNPAE